ncbi:MAG: hypothetical protein ACRDCF_01535 [Mycoplasmoidaceae bacterium]
MAKKNKNKKAIPADSIDVDSSKIENKNVESKKQKHIEDNHIETVASETPFYLKYRIPIFTSIYKTKNNFYLNDKKKFFIYISLIILALLVSVTLIIVGGLWLGGVFGENTVDNDISFIPGLIMAVGVSILVVV